MPRNRAPSERTNLSYQGGLLAARAGALHVINELPWSRFAELIRALKLAVDLDGPRNSTQIIGFTSSVPGEGKSTIAAALAGHVAQVGRRAILIDCDLRNPALSRSFARQAKCTTGITEVLSGARSLDEAIWKDPTTDLAFLPAGNMSKVRNTSEIIQSDSMKRLFDLLRERYDYVIVDLSPLIPVVDARATTRLCDAYVLLTEWGQTNIDVTRQALQEARQIREKLLGIVLNKVDTNLIDLYEDYHSNRYRSKYFAADVYAYRE